MIFGNITSLADLKRDKWIHKHIIWDIEPKQLMEPRCKITTEGKEEWKIINGYLFYIDKMGNKPTLFLMCHTAAGYAETVAKIGEIPDDLIAAAIEENKQKEYFGMYPINKSIEKWLKKALAIEG